MKITNIFGLPESFVNMATTDYVPTPKRYSVTTILDSTRAVMLKRRHHDEIEEDVSDLIFALFGQVAHSVLEHAGTGDTEFTETKLLTDMGDGYTLSGIFDLYSPDNKEVSDYKTTSVYKVIKGDYSDWRKQLLIYAWQLRKIGFEANKGTIIAIMRDWQKSKAKFNKTYPRHQVKKITFNFDERDFAEIEEYVNSRFKEIIEAEKLPDSELPLCTDEERWYSGDKYAVMKKGRKSALRLLDTMEDAEDWKGRNGGDSIVHRPGIYRKCSDYCSGNMFCDFYLESVKPSESENDSE